MLKTTPLLTILLASSFSSLASTTQAAIVIDFEELPVPASAYYNGNTTSSFDPFRGNYTVVGQQMRFGELETLQIWDSQGIEFNNNYQAAYDSWRGWAWSSVVDKTTPGYGNQYASAPGGGSNGSGGAAAEQKYAVSFGDDAYFNIPLGLELQSIDVTNTTYAFLSMQNGDTYSKKFGGPSGNDADLFQVTLTGYDAEGGTTGTGNAIGSITIDLADFRFTDNSQDFILNQWQTVDVSSLSGARSVSFSYFSTDSFGGFINNPVYVAVDNMKFVPEPSSLALALAAGYLTSRRRRRQARPGT